DVWDALAAPEETSMPPTALLEKLQAIGRKVKVYGVALGAGRVVAIAVGLLVAAVFLDWVVHGIGIAPGGLPGPARLLVELAALGVFVSFLIRWVARPALARHSPGDIAGWIEERYPQFGDTLRSTVNFISSDVPGSQAMKERVVLQAAEQVSQADLTKVINPRPLWNASAGAIASIGGLILLTILVGPSFRHVAFSRLFHPLSGQPL